jgi:DNA-directed RNA polymerase specialized sigma24 family protein
MLRYFFIFLSLGALALADDKVTFDDHISAIFQQTCCNCHNPDKTKGGLDLSSYTTTIKGSSGGKIVEPGDTGSALLSCVLQGGEKKMPPEGEPLGKPQISLIKRWIEDGLLENKTSAVRKPSKPKFATTVQTGSVKPTGPPPMPEHLLLEPVTVTTRAASIHAMVASPWAPLLAATGQQQILLYHTETLELIGILPFPEGEPVSLAFTPDARYLIVGGGIAGKSGLTVTFDIRTGDRVLSVGKEFDSVLATDIRPGFDIVATGGPSRLLKLWNTENGSLIKSIKKHSDWITALDFSPDGVLLASGDRNGGVYVWESQTAGEFHTLRGHQSAITALSFRSDSNILATSSEDGSIRYWEMNGGSVVKSIPNAHPGGVTAFAFGPDGSSVSAGRDKTVKLWKPDFNPARQILSNLNSIPTALALEFTGNRLFIADNKGLIQSFQASDSKLLCEVQGNPPTIADRLIKLSFDLGKQDPQAESFKQTQSSFKRWTAAAIQNLALNTRRDAEKSRTALDEKDLKFTELATKHSLESTALNKLRNECEQLARLLTSSEISPPVAAEIKATQAAVQTKIDQQNERMQQVENDLLLQREAIEHSAPLTHRRDRDATAILKSYFTTLNCIPSK